MKKNDKSKIVILGTKHDNKQAKNISNEPEMIELKRMIQDGVLDRDRTIEHLKKDTILSVTPNENKKDQDQEEDS